MKLKGPSKARFETIFSDGRRVSGPLARVVAIPGTGQIGIATAKRIGNRPARNRAKRRFREAIRLQPDLAVPSLDFVLIVNVDGASAEFERIQLEVRTLFTRAKERWASDLEFS